MSAKHIVWNSQRIDDGLRVKSENQQKGDFFKRKLQVKK